MKITVVPNYLITDVALLKDYLVPLFQLLHIAETQHAAEIFFTNSQVLEAFQSLTNTSASIRGLPDPEEGRLHVHYPKFTLMLLLDTDHIAKNGGSISIFPEEFPVIMSILKKIKAGDAHALNLNILNLRKIAKLKSNVLKAIAEESANRNELHRLFPSW
jgi:hypothetical protein